MLALSACETPFDYTVHTSKNRSEPWQDPANGLLIGSMTLSADPEIRLPQVFIWLRSVGDEHRIHVLLDDYLARQYLDFDLGRGRIGRVFVLELPPGSYYLNSYSVGAIGSGVSYNPSGPPLPKVDLAAGKAVYFGSFDFSATYDQRFGYFGREKYINGAKISVSDEFERDNPVLREKYPNLQVGQITQNLFGPFGDFEKVIR